MQPEILPCIPENLSTNRQNLEAFVDLNCDDVIAPKREGEEK
jgi:hypothetical protein